MSTDGETTGGGGGGGGVEAGAEAEAAKRTYSKTAAAALPGALDPLNDSDAASGTGADVSSRRVSGNPAARKRQFGAAPRAALSGDVGSSSGAGINAVAAQLQRESAGGALVAGTLAAGDAVPNKTIEDAWDALMRLPVKYGKVNVPGAAAKPATEASAQQHRDDAGGNSNSDSACVTMDGLSSEISHSLLAALGHDSQNSLTSWADAPEPDGSNKRNSLMDSGEIDQEVLYPAGDTARRAVEYDGAGAAECSNIGANKPMDMRTAAQQAAQFLASLPAEERGSFVLPPNQMAALRESVSADRSTPNMDAIAVRYRNMLKFDVAPSVVESKMKMEGLPAHVIKNVLEGAVDDEKEAHSPECGSTSMGGAIGAGDESKSEQSRFSRTGPNVPQVSYETDAVAEESANVGAPLRSDPIDTTTDSGMRRTSPSLNTDVELRNSAVMMKELMSDLTNQGSNGKGHMHGGDIKGVHDSSPLTTANHDREDVNKHTNLQDDPPAAKGGNAGATNTPMDMRMAAQQAAQFLASLPAEERGSFVLPPSQMAALRESVSDDHLTPTEEAFAVPYRNMLKFNIARNVVESKMKAEGLPAHVIENVLEGAVDDKKKAHGPECGGISDGGATRAGGASREKQSRFSRTGPNVLQDIDETDAVAEESANVGAPLSDRIGTAIDFGTPRTSPASSSLLPNTDVELRRSAAMMEELMSDLTFRYQGGDGKGHTQGDDMKAMHDSTDSFALPTFNNDSEDGNKPKQDMQDSGLSELSAWD